MQKQRNNKKGCNKKIDLRNKTENNNRLNSIEILLGGGVCTKL